MVKTTVTRIPVTGETVDDKVEDSNVPVINRDLPSVKPEGDEELRKSAGKRLEEFYFRRLMHPRKSTVHSGGLAGYLILAQGCLDEMEAKGDVGFWLQRQIDAYRNAVSDGRENYRLANDPTIIWN